MYNIEQINEDVKEKLSEERYIHSVGVMNQSEYLAKKYGQNVELAKIVGIAHDIAKEMSKEEKLDYTKQNNIEIDEIEKTNVGLLHGKIGANICKNKYGFTEQMQNAIKYHTTANINMDIFAKIIFVADKTEENRKYDNLERVKELGDKNLDECMLYILNYMIKENIDKGKLIHPSSILMRNKLISEGISVI